MTHGRLAASTAAVGGAVIIGGGENGGAGRSVYASAKVLGGAAYVVAGLEGLNSSTAIHSVETFSFWRPSRYAQM